MESIGYNKEVFCVCLSGVIVIHRGARCSLILERYVSTETMVAASLLAGNLWRWMKCDTTSKALHLHLEWHQERQSRSGINAFESRHRWVFQDPLQGPKLGTFLGTRPMGETGTSSILTEKSIRACSWNAQRALGD